MMAVKPAILCLVMIMKGSKDLLSSILKTTQMGQTGIRAVLKMQLNSDLQTALRSQLREYDSIEQEAQSLAASRGWQLEQLDPGVKAMADMTTRMRLSYGNSSSKTAAMMIQGNTRGMIKGLKNLHHYNNSDERVAVLSRKLLDCEQENIKQMQGFV